LLSGGMDHAINLVGRANGLFPRCGQSAYQTQWVIPEDAIEAAGTDKPRRIMYPHFSTAKIHSDYVDKCVRRDRPGGCVSVLTNAFFFFFSLQGSFSRGLHHFQVGQRKHYSLVDDTKFQLQEPPAPTGRRTDHA